jgi:polyhydroxyalkanoate synthesis regulator phasin
MLDDLRTYLQMATGMTEATTAKAREAVSGLLATGMSLTSKAVPAPEMMGQVQELADDLMTTSKNNREMLTAMIRSEVDKAVGRMGFVREDELAALRRHVQKLEGEVQELKRATAAPATPTVPTASDAGQSDAGQSYARPTPETDVNDQAAEDESSPAPKPKKKKKILVDPEAGA